MPLLSSLISGGATWDKRAKHPQWLHLPGALSSAPLSLPLPLALTHRTWCILEVWSVSISPRRHSAQDACSQEELQIKWWRGNSLLWAIFFLPAPLSAFNIPKSWDRQKRLLLSPVAGWRAHGSSPGWVTIDQIYGFAAVGRKKASGMRTSSVFNIPPMRTPFIAIICKRHSCGHTILSLLLSPWQVGYGPHPSDKSYREIR
jgi:hypothetical protein